MINFALKKTSITLLVLGIVFADCSPLSFAKGEGIPEILTSAQLPSLTRFKPEASAGVGLLAHLQIEDEAKSLPQGTLGRREVARPLVVLSDAKSFNREAAEVFAEEDDAIFYYQDSGVAYIWVTDENGPVNNGDFLELSVVPGYAARQKVPDKDKRIARVIESVDWRTNTVDIPVWEDQKAYVSMLRKGSILKTVDPEANLIGVMDIGHVNGIVQGGVVQFTKRSNRISNPNQMIATKANWIEDGKVHEVDLYELKARLQIANKDNLKPELAEALPKRRFGYYEEALKVPTFIIPDKPWTEVPFGEDREGNPLYSHNKETVQTLRVLHYRSEEIERLKFGRLSYKKRLVACLLMRKELSEEKETVYAITDRKNGLKAGRWVASSGQIFTSSFRQPFSVIPHVVPATETGVGAIGVVEKICGPDDLKKSGVLLEKDEMLIKVVTHGKTKVAATIAAGEVGQDQLLQLSPVEGIAGRAESGKETIAKTLEAVDWAVDRLPVTKKVLSDIYRSHLPQGAILKKVILDEGKLAMIDPRHEETDRKNPQNFQFVHAEQIRWFDGSREFDISKETLLKKLEGISGQKLDIELVNEIEIERMNADAPKFIGSPVFHMADSWEDIPPGFLKDGSAVADHFVPETHIRRYVEITEEEPVERVGYVKTMYPVRLVDAQLLVNG